MGDSKDEVRKIVYDGQEYTIVKEGLAEILRPVRKDEPQQRTGQLPPQDSTFYNPIQQFNRDLSVLAIRVFAEDYILSKKTKDHRAENHLKNTETKAEPAFNKVKAEEGQNSKGNDECPQPRSRDGSPTKRKRGDGREENETSENAKKIKSMADGSEDRFEAMSGSDPTAKTSVPVNVPAGPKALTNPPFRILDALSATGLRALRYSKEIEQVTLVTANDLSRSAFNAIKLHIRHNSVSEQVHPIAGDAVSHMYYVGTNPNSLLPDGQRGKYQVIDLDPFGSSAPFMDAAVQAIQDGGMLCVTCTDSALFASLGYLEKTYSQYGGLPVKGPHSHEGGLRLIIHAVATSAARYGLAIEPLLSLSIDYYVRIFIRVRRSPSEVKLLAGKTMEVFGCDHGCGAWTTQALVRTQIINNRHGQEMYKFSPGQAPVADRMCSHCGLKTHLAGPMWGGYLHNPFFIQRMLDMLPSLDADTYGTIPRMQGMLLTARDEIHLPEAVTQLQENNHNMGPVENALSAPISRLPPSHRDDSPFFILPSSLAKCLHCEAPTIAAFRSALIKLNYRVTRSHAKAGSIKTDAPWAVIWEVMREWVRQRVPKRVDKLKEGTISFGLMRHDRSNSSLNAIREELRTISTQAKDAEEVQRRLRILLAQLDQTRVEPSSNLEEVSLSAVAEGRKEVSSMTSETQKYGDLNRLEIVFDEKLGREPMAEKVVRYPANPRPDWGPQVRAKRK